MSQREAARRSRVAHSTVGRWWQHFQMTRSCKRKPGSGRPRISLPHQDQQLVQLVRQHRFATTRFYRAAWLQRCRFRHWAVPSLRTVYRRVFMAGFHSCRPVVRIPLSQLHKNQRVAWCMAHREWTGAEWAKVLWSDESRFVLDFHDGRVRVRRLPTERFLDDCILEHDRYGVGSLMVWAVMDASHRSRIVRIDGNLNSERYVREILQPILLPFAAGAQQRDGTEAPPRLFMQDNARPHTARCTREFLTQAGVPLLDWPARSPDLNPIEHMWDELGRGLRDREVPPTTLDELWTTLQTMWQQIPPARQYHLVDSMPRRVTACLDKAGGHTHY